MPRARSGDARIDRFVVPPAQLIVMFVVGAVAGLLAGSRPARRASRLPLLRALAAE